MAWHQEEARLREIHPAILADKVVEAGPNLRYRGLALASYSIHERTAASKRGDWQAIWRYDRDPPHTLRIEIRESGGILGAGTYWENAYTEVGDGTLIETKGRLVLSGVPPSKTASLADRILSRIDEEDLRYLKLRGL
ncbi:MAG: hypothetical protein ACE5LS_09265 [Thermoplasmata archaeon]